MITHSLLAGQLTERQVKGAPVSLPLHLVPRFVYHNFPDATGKLATHLMPIGTKIDSPSDWDTDVMLQGQSSSKADASTIYSSLWKRFELPEYMKPPEMPEAIRQQVLMPVHNRLLLFSLVPPRAD
jgi:hypothetical protein